MSWLCAVACRTELRKMGDPTEEAQNCENIFKDSSARNEFNKYIAISATTADLNLESCACIKAHLARAKTNNSFRRECAQFAHKDNRPVDFGAWARGSGGPNLKTRFRSAWNILWNNRMRLNLTDLLSIAQHLRLISLERRSLLKTGEKFKKVSEGLGNVFREGSTRVDVPTSEEERESFRDMLQDVRRKDLLADQSLETVISFLSLSHRLEVIADDLESCRNQALALTMERYRGNYVL